MITCFASVWSLFRFSRCCLCTGIRVTAITIMARAFISIIRSRSFPRQSNILRLLRPNKMYTELEAKVLDLALVIHAEHGGGNNSSFTTHVVTSSGTDTYSTIAAALGSLKGPKHGGANIKVVGMFEDMRKR